MSRAAAHRATWSATVRSGAPSLLRHRDGSSSEIGAIIDLLEADPSKKRDAHRVVQMLAKMR